jgi:hypothetical protein
MNWVLIKKVVELTGYTEDAWGAVLHVRQHCCLERLDITVGLLTSTQN